MAYQTGVIALNTGTKSYSITFPAAFSSPPEIIIPKVQNIAGIAPTVLSINADVVNPPTTTGFEVLLSHLPDSADYTLVWIAGGINDVFEAITQGQKVSGFPALTDELDDLDKFIVLRWGPYIRTQLLDWAALRAYFAERVAIPASPNVAGASGQIAVPSGVSPWLYLHNGTRWTRVPVDDSAAWGGESVLTQFREGVKDMSSGTQVHTVTFSTAFDALDVVDGTELSIKCTLRNLTDNPLSMLHGIVTAQSRTGFTFFTNAPTDSANFKLAWSARLRTDA